METGSGLDLVKRSHIAGCERYVTQNDGITLTIAKGELDANEEITLYINRLRLKISPSILEDTPDVQSLGLRCVDDGFAFVWPSFSKDPYMIEPETGRILHMTVENYCPYLVDPISAVPTRTLTNQALAAELRP